jgi:uncharacterized protein with PQ loop repeat
MDFLNDIPAHIFETLGFIVGISANVVIAIQVYKEYKSSQPSSLSLGYVVGWWFIFLFWMIYGIRFDAQAIAISNALATFIQSTLWVVIMKKNQKQKLD